ncbi:MAG: Subunit ChlI of Mg-chelatase [Candidatus Methanoperedenaceae archaeon GB50]|nr:MAG: Subunit ChlI of Mg-chelatase [Candidatus Methanoperedenaceae archaeon GB50]
MPQPHKKKEGSSFDLPIALGILAASGQIKPKKLKEYMFLGELSLDGHIKSVRGVLPVALLAKKNKLKGVIIPKANMAEAAVIPQIEVIPAEKSLTSSGVFKWAHRNTSSKNCIRRKYLNKNITMKWIFRK